ncbi:MAG: hypothetical protein J6W54_03330 [Fibrobacter sp.]|nr:hypothetical protein [Fibrobacter sp.]
MIFAHFFFVFDMIFVYIIDVGRLKMKTVNDMNVDVAGKAVLKRKIFMLCAVIPFVLFLAGVLAPVWTDNFIVYVFALLPYYLYTFYVSNDWIDGKRLYDTKIGECASSVWVVGIAVCAFFSLFLAVMFWDRPESFLYGSSWMALLNCGPGFAWAFWAMFLHKTRYSRWPVLFAPPAN